MTKNVVVITGGGSKMGLVASLSMYRRDFNQFGLEPLCDSDSSKNEARRSDVPESDINPETGKELVGLLKRVSDMSKQNLTCLLIENLRQLNTIEGVKTLRSSQDKLNEMIHLKMETANDITSFELLAPILYKRRVLGDIILYLSQHPFDEIENVLIEMNAKEQFKLIVDKFILHATKLVYTNLINADFY